MKKFAFSLQRVLNFKRTLYDKERNTLAQLRAERFRVEERRDATVQQMAAMTDEFQQKAAAGGVGIGEVNKLNFHASNADMLVRELEREMARLEILIEKQLQIVIELDKEVKSLEKLREAQWDEYVAESMREEQQRILEIVSGRFAEAQRGEGDQAQGL